MRRDRIALTTTFLALLIGSILYAARALATRPPSIEGALASVTGAVVYILVLGSFYEWLVHRFIYHAGSRIPLLHGIYEIHVNGHHWHRFPPDRYVEHGAVERIPIYPPDPYGLCGVPAKRFLAWWGQYALYLSVGIPFAFAPAWLLTESPLFTGAAILTGLVVCYFFIRVHDIIHYPAMRMIERQAWFKFLDRHHYIHHIDTRANLNFLLPLCDWLFGTLRWELTTRELGRWPTFEGAKKLSVSAMSEVAAGGLARQTS